MQSIRCRCGKIVCQVENVPQLPRMEEGPQALQGPAAIILCRHCKRYVVLRFPALSGIYTTSDAEQVAERSLITT